MNSYSTEPDQRTGQVGREGFTALARRPLVVLALVCTAFFQVVAVNARGVKADGVQLRRSVAALIELNPAVAQPDPAVKAAWIERTLQRKAEELAAEYRSEGFDLSNTLAAQIGEAAAEFEIDPQVAFGLVRAESSFRNRATSRVGAVGLTQLMPRTAAWIEPGVTRSELRDAKTNLRVGFKYLRYLIDKYQGDEKLALLAYNRGPGTVDRALKRGRNPDNGYADFVYGNENHGHRLFTR